MLIEWTVALLELALLGYVGWRAARSLRRVRSKLREGDPDAFDAIRRAARETIGWRRAADVLAQEMAMFYYAFFSWRSPLPCATDGFTSYRKNSYGIFLFAIVIVLVIETIAVHLLIYFLWSAAIAWIFTAISLYTVIWMVTDWQALRLRTIAVTPERINIRLGTRWDVEIPRDAIVYVGPPVQNAHKRKALRFVLIGDPDVEIRLSRPVTALGLYGLRRTSSLVRLQIDDPERFIALVRPPAAPD